MTVYLADKYPLPEFVVDERWPQLPKGTQLGQVSGLSVDKNDDIWILQRPNSLNKWDLCQSTPCNKTLPHVIKFSTSGELLKSWGGASIAPTIKGVNQWPKTVHGLFVDQDQTVWLAGNGKGDHVVLNFNDGGEYLGQYGLRENTEGNASQRYLGNPADIHHRTDNGELLIADGYINRRVIGFNNQRQQFTQIWGAYGAPPESATRTGTFDTSQAVGGKQAEGEASVFGDIMHCITQDHQGRTYVCDRRNNRVQIFKTNSDGSVTFVRNLIVAPETDGPGSATDIAFSPDGKYLYIADMANGKIWIYWQETFELLASIGSNGSAPGQFIWLHSIDTDSAGNLYTTEVRTGRRAQKIILVKKSN